MSIRHYRINDPTVAVEFMDGEAVALHFGNGRYFGINPSGAWIMTQLLWQASVEQLCASLHLRPVAWGRPEIESFVLQLVDENLLVVVDEVQEPTMPVQIPDELLGSMQPRLDVYRELEELLKLDPIHDADAAGWPVARGCP